MQCPGLVQMGIDLISHSVLCFNNNNNDQNNGNNAADL